MDVTQFLKAPSKHSYMSFFFPTKQVFFYAIFLVHFTTIPSGKYNKNFVELSLSPSLQKSLYLE